MTRFATSQDRLVRFTQDHTTYVLGRRRDLTQCGYSAVYEPVRFPESARVLRQWLRSGNVRELQQISGAARHAEPSEILEALEHELASPRASIALLRRTRALVVGSAGAPTRATHAPTRPAPSPPEARPASPAPAPEPALTWLALEVVDDRGEPLANARYEVTLPSGETRAGTLDASGRARLERITAPGRALVRFPDLEPEYVLRRAS